MTRFATLARILARAHLVTLPALLVNYHFGAECFIRNIDRIGAMAFRACVDFLFYFFRFIVTNLTFGRGRLENIRMGAEFRVFLLYTS